MYILYDFCIILLKEWTPLLVAVNAIRPSLQIVQLLLSAGADVNIADTVRVIMSLGSISVCVDHNLGF